MILVVGAASRLGRAVSAKLAGSGTAFRAACRRPEKAALDLPAASLVKLDLGEPRTFAQALEGASAVLAAAHGLTGRARDSVQRVDIDGHIALIDEAKRSGARKFVYTSAMGAAEDHPSVFLRAKAQVERHLEDSGLDFTILRPSAFMEVHAHDLIGRAVLAGKPVRLIGDGAYKRNFVAVEDVADIAVAALTSERWARQTVKIGGPQNLSDREVAETYARLAGVEARYQSLSPASLAMLSRMLGVFHPGVGRLLQMPLDMAKRPAPEFDPSGMEALLSRPPTSLEAFARQAIASR